MELALWAKVPALAADWVLAELERSWDKAAAELTDKATGDLFLLKTK
jgi:hypothetical protein